MKVFAVYLDAHFYSVENVLIHVNIVWHYKYFLNKKISYSEPHFDDIKIYIFYFIYFIFFQYYFLHFYGGYTGSTYLTYILRSICTLAKYLIPLVFLLFRS